jgi:hypothetical protein
VHDLENFDEKTILPNGLNNTRIISDNGKIHLCICCFGCWVKTPEREKETVRKLVEANGINSFAQKMELYFYDKIEDLEGVL